MKQYAFFLLSCLSAVTVLASPSAHAATKPALFSKESPAIPAGPHIRVLLEKNVPSAILEAKGEFIVLDRASGEVLSSGLVGKRFVVHALQHGLRWGEEFPDVFQISVVPRHPATMLYVNGIQYRGAVSIYHSKNNLVTIVNEVPIEDYIKSTLAVEVQDSISKEAMAAIAITKRTEAFAKTMVANQSKRPWDVTAQEANYFGYAVTRQKNQIDECVDWTRFMVLESPKEMQKRPLTFEKAQELADKGYDAKRILQSTCPSAKLGVTTVPKPTTVR